MGLAAVVTWVAFRVPGLAGVFIEASTARQRPSTSMRERGGMAGLLATLGLGLALAFSESGLGLGMIVPGETAVVILAATMRTPEALVALGAAVALGASLGDHVGYGLGRRYGDSLRESKVVARLGRRHFDRATGLLRTHGGRAVFLTRLVPVIRTLTPAAAGASGLEYRRFLPASLAGSALWATAYVGGGSAVASASALVHDTLGRAAWLVLVMLVLAALPAVVIWTIAGVRPTRAAPDVVSYERYFRSESELVMR